MCILVLLLKVSLTLGRLFNMFVPQFLICKIETKKKKPPYKINEDKASYICKVFNVCECPVKAECVMHTRNLSTGEAETGDLQIRGQPRLCSKTTSKQNTQNCSARGPGTSPLAHFRNTYIAH